MKGLNMRKSKLTNLLARLHRDEQGATMLEYILIIAAVALPMVGIIIYFRNDIYEWAKELWENVRSESQFNP